jgi:hypothetical protein
VITPETPRPIRKPSFKPLLLSALILLLAANLYPASLEEDFRRDTGFSGEVAFTSRGDLQTFSGQFSAWPVNSLEDFEARVEAIGRLVEPYLKLPAFESFGLRRIQHEAPDIIKPGYIYIPAEYISYAFDQTGSDRLPLENSLKGNVSFKYDHQKNQVRFWNSLVFFTYPESTRYSEARIRELASGWLNQPLRDSLTALLVLKDITPRPTADRPSYREAGYFWEAGDQAEFMLIDDRNGKLVMKRSVHPEKRQVPQDTLLAWAKAAESKLPWSPESWSELSFWQDGSLAGCSGRLPKRLAEQNLPPSSLVDSLFSAFAPLFVPPGVSLAALPADEENGIWRWMPQGTGIPDPVIQEDNLEISYSAKYGSYAVRNNLPATPETHPRVAIDQYQAMDAVSKICLSENYGSLGWLCLKQKEERAFQKNRVEAELVHYPLNPLYKIDQGRIWQSGRNFSYNVLSRPSGYVPAWKVTYWFTDLLAYVDAVSGKVLSLNYELWRLRR